MGFHYFWPYGGHSVIFIIGNPLLLFYGSFVANIRDLVLILLAEENVWSYTEEK